MPLLRRDHDVDQTKYRMREKLFSIGDDFWIENEVGERVFKVDGKALRLRDTLILQDLDGNELFKVQKKALRVRGTMEIERDGETVATVKKALVHLVRDRFSVEVGQASQMPIDERTLSAWNAGAPGWALHLTCQRRANVTSTRRAAAEPRQNAELICPSVEPARGGCGWPVDVPFTAARRER